MNAGDALLQRLIAESRGAILDRLARAGAGRAAEDAEAGRGDAALAYGVVSIPLLAFPQLQKGFNRC